MGHSASGLSDVLRDMARREARKKRPAAGPGATRPKSAPAQPKDQLPESRAARPARPQKSTTSKTPAPTPAARPTRPPQPSGADSLHAAAVPVFLTVAALLLIPGVWAVLTLLGFAVWRSDWEGAGTMALAMLACFPIAAALVAGAWYFRTSAVRKPLRVPERGRR